MDWGVGRRISVPKLAGDGLHRRSHPLHGVVAIQEVKRNTTAIRMLLEWLGPNWDVIISDVTAGSLGNAERSAYVFDTRRVQHTGLAGEIVLLMTEDEVVEQFARSPYLVGFESGQDRFSLLTAHIKYGKKPKDRLGEITAIAEYVADEIRDRAKEKHAEEKNLIVLGDFNIDKRVDDPLYDAFVSRVLWVPDQLDNLKTTYGKEDKYYDQIAWFRGDDFTLEYTDRAGRIDFSGAVFKEISTHSMSFRISDHFPLWVEFNIDRSANQMGRTLGLSELALATPKPDPFSIVED